MKLLCAAGHEIRDEAMVIALINTMKLPCHVQRVRLSDKGKKVVAKRPFAPTNDLQGRGGDGDRNRAIVKPGSYLILKLRVDTKRGSKGTCIAAGDRVALRDNNSTLATGIVMRAFDTNARLRREVENKTRMEERKSRMEKMAQRK